MILISKSFFLEIIDIQFGNWTNNGSCIGDGKNHSCGPGNIIQIRNCTDGTIETCDTANLERLVTCKEVGQALPDCERKLGDWINDGDCAANDDDKSCGPGTIWQKRNCTDGTTDKCDDIETERTISCKEAGVALPDCEGES